MGEPQRNQPFGAQSGFEDSNSFSSISYSRPFSYNSGYNTPSAPPLEASPLQQSPREGSFAEQLSWDTSIMNPDNNLYPHGQQHAPMRTTNPNAPPSPGLSPHSGNYSNQSYTQPYSYPSSQIAPGPGINAYYGTYSPASMPPTSSPSNSIGQSIPSFNEIATSPPMGQQLLPPPSTGHFYPNPAALMQPSLSQPRTGPPNQVPAWPYPLDSPRFEADMRNRQLSQPSGRFSPTRRVTSSAPSPYSRPTGRRRRSSNSLPYVIEHHGQTPDRGYRSFSSVASMQQQAPNFGGPNVLSRRNRRQELTPEEALLMEIRQRSPKPDWSQTQEEWNKAFSKDKQIPALQMRYWRIRERLRVWTERDAEAASQGQDNSTSFRPWEHQRNSNSN